MRPPRKPNEPLSADAPGAGRDLNDPLQIGITIVGTTAILGGIGWWLDSLLHTFPILMALGATLGLFGILYTTYLRLKEADRRAEQSKRHESETGERP
ncbi:MAG: AtpZ/AtpI family protein [bacterium]|nr:AtpZ/AtpI family protein [bacterium]